MASPREVPRSAENRLGLGLEVHDRPFTVSPRDEDGVRRRAG